jgi:hypothetical protein
MQPNSEKEKVETNSVQQRVVSLVARWSLGIELVGQSHIPKHVTLARGM